MLWWMPMLAFEGTFTMRRLTALGFAVGSTVHAVGFALLAWGIELYGPDYPVWRHVVMALVDASIAWIALRLTPWLVFALLAFLAEQLLVHRRIGTTSGFVL